MVPLTPLGGKELTFRVMRSHPVGSCRSTTSTSCRSLKWLPHRTDILHKPDAITDIIIININITDKSSEFLVELATLNVEQFLSIKSTN